MSISIISGEAKTENLVGGDRTKKAMKIAITLGLSVANADSSNSGVAARTVS